MIMDEFETMLLLHLNDYGCSWDNDVGSMKMMW